MVYFVIFKLNKGATTILMLIPGLSQEDCLATLRTGIYIVPFSCVWVAHESELTMKGPETQICWFLFDGRTSLLNAFASPTVGVAAHAALREKA